MPNGALAPGKVLPKFSVPTKGWTSEVGSGGGSPAAAAAVAPGGPSRPPPSSTAVITPATVPAVRARIPPISDRMGRTSA